MKLDHIAEQALSEITAGGALLALLFPAICLAVPYLLS